jgi:polar amino acid transport system substrate-binding protein
MRKSLLRVVPLVLGASLLAAFAASSYAGGSGSVPPPARIKKAGSLLFCSDMTYPPQIFRVGSKIQGSDFEIASDIARRMGVKANFIQVGFDAIIQAINSKKCDAIIVGMNDTPDRAKRVHFNDYLSVGQNFMVKKGNPKHVKAALDVCGLAAGAALATSNLAYLKTLSGKCTAAGKKAIEVIGFHTDPEGAQSLKTGKVDVYETDAPTVAYFVLQHPKDFQVAGPTVNRTPAGIATRKNDTQLQSALKKAIHQMYADGTMKRILGKWKSLSTLMHPAP